MPVSQPDTPLYPFLQGGGELGELTRQYDWSRTTLGTPDAWPQSLRTIVGVILHARFPMFLWWGEDLIQFYNDAYRPSLGNTGKHPAVGQKGADTWGEIWPLIQPMIDGVIAGGEATWSENQLIPIYRDDQLTNVYWTFSYSPVLDESGKPGGVLVTCQETTGVVAQTVQSQQNRQLLDLLFTQVNAAIAQLDTAGRFTDVNERYCQLLGYTRQELLQMSLREVTHPEDAPSEQQRFDDCVALGTEYLITKRYIRKDGRIVWVNNGVSRVVTTLGGTVITAISIDISADKAYQQQLLESENKLRSIIAAAPAGIGLFVGRELIIEYPNQTFIDIVGKGPGVEGLPLRQAMPELESEEQPFLAILDKVYTSGEPFISPASLVRIEQQGVLRDNYYNISYTPIRNTDGDIYAILDIAIDVTEPVKMQQALQRSEARFQNLVRDANVGMIVLMGQELRVSVVNEAYCRLIGHRPEAMLNQPLFAVIPQAESYFRPLLEQVMATGEPFAQPETPYSVQSARGERLEGFIDYLYQPYREADGRITGVMAVVNDITEQVKARQKIAESEATLRAIIDHARAAIGVYVGRDMVIEHPNQIFIDILGKGPDIAGRPLREVLPELESEGQPLLQILDEVYTSGVAYTTTGTLIKIFRYGELTHNYYNFSYTPVLDPDGRTYEIVVVAIDVTEQVLARHKLEESERFARTIFYNSPVAKLVFVGPDMILREANEKMLELFGRDASMLGKPILESIPELSRTPLIDQYRQVLATGEQHVALGQHLVLVKNGEPYGGFYDYTYKPLSDASGHRFGVICTMIEVTQQVVAQQKLEEAEAGLRGAVELAQLGTWSIDVATGGLTYSDRLIEWFGYDPAAQAYTQVIPILSAEDQARVAAAVARALGPESDGIYEETYTVIHPRTGQKRVLHAHGKTVFNASGQAIRLNGTAQDITLQRELQMALEQEVQQRTQELAATNEELAATNEELEASNEEHAALNEELEEANRLLMRSNDNLQTFAYVASHDLQEPLRKIQQFGDLLKGRYMNSVGEELIYVERMQTAASRMSTLIKDLLNYSRIATQQDTHGSVDLNKVVDRVLATLDLSIQELGAQINVEPLPTVLGDASQLEQLVQNLLSNALKFSRVNRQGAPAIPRISITAQRLSGSELPPSVKPSRLAPAYEQIRVSDNGVGFEEKYLDRIFQVFQRLHGKNEFAGTGVGLAIAQRVVENHGGAITATSQPGQGAIFQVYLPV